MNVALRFKRWRLLRSTPLLTAQSAEGAVVQAVGRAHANPDVEPFVPPLVGVPCVVAWSKITTGTPRDQRNPAVQLERLHIRPFTLDTGDMRVIVDASHIDLLLPVYAEGNTREISVREGRLIAVIGTVLRDGVELPEGDVAFRESRPACKLVGNKRYPVVITEPA